MTFSLRLKTDALITLPLPAVMGVVNVSPNSFFMPHNSLDKVLKTVDEMIAAGVDIIDDVKLCRYSAVRREGVNVLWNISLP